MRNRKPLKKCFGYKANMKIQKKYSNFHKEKVWFLSCFNVHFRTGKILRRINYNMVTNNWMGLLRMHLHDNLFPWQQARSLYTLNSPPPCSVPCTTIWCPEPFSVNSALILCGIISPRTWVTCWSNDSFDFGSTGLVEP